MVPTEALGQSLVEQGLHHVAVVARGADTQQFSPERRSSAQRATWGTGPQTRVAACVGRLAPEKNLDLLLRAFEAMQASQPDSRLLRVGDGPLRAALQARCPLRCLPATGRVTTWPHTMRRPMPSSSPA